jgi:hypothetical protein
VDVASQPTLNLNLGILDPRSRFTILHTPEPRGCDTLMVAGSTIGGTIQSSELCQRSFQPCGIAGAGPLPRSHAGFNSNSAKVGSERRGGWASGFLAKTRKPERALQNLLERDRMFTDRLRKEVGELELRAIQVNTAEGDSANLVAKIFGL